MKRIKSAARPDWKEKAESVGFTYHSHGQDPTTGEFEGTNWNEDVHYVLTSEQVDDLEEATNELHNICMEAVDHVVTKDQDAIVRDFKIPDEYADYLIESWKRQDPHVYGRFDLAYDGKASIKMLEYNADTPTLLIESALVQWFWLQDKFPDKDQFNSIHEKLLERWTMIKSRLPGKNLPFYFSAVDEMLEETQTVKYLQDLAIQSGMDARYIGMNDIGWNGTNFTDLNENPMSFWFKLFPWEWIVGNSEFGKNILHDNMGIVEPIWKMILSNKAILPLLWKLNPNHPNLLAAYHCGPKGEDYVTGISGNWVKKPILAREGANISFIENGKVTLETDGPYGEGAPFIMQQKFNLPKFDGQYTMLGSWVVGDEAAGVIFREHSTPIVINTSRVVPHYFE